MARLGGALAAVPLPLRTVRLELRLHVSADAPVLARLINDPRVLSGLAIQPGRLSTADEARFIRNNRRASSSGDQLTLPVIRRALWDRISGEGLGHHV